MRRLMTLGWLLLLAGVLFACGENSKVNQVIESQMKENDNVPVTTEENKPQDIAPITDMKTQTEDKVLTSGETVSKGQNGIDVDLTVMSSTMVYSEVFNMMGKPEDYFGKTVKMQGQFMVYTNVEKTQYYPAVIIADATACCSQGLEFVLTDDPGYPNGYPELGTEIVVSGEFDTYEEDGETYCHLKNAKLALAE